MPIGLKHGLGLFGQAKHGTRDRRQANALLGQLDPPRGAAQQGDLVVLLQCLDVAGHRWLADKQTAGSTGKASLAGHRIKGSELEQVHIYRPDLWLA
ncbi:hypothetical protein D3C85_1092540 [compost metagenome]